MSFGTKESNSFTCMKIYLSFQVGFFLKTPPSFRLAGHDWYATLSLNEDFESSRLSRSPLSFIMEEYRKTVRDKSVTHGSRK